MRDSIELKIFTSNNFYQLYFCVYLRFIAIFKKKCTNNDFL